MRNIAVNDVDDLPRRVLALGSDYPANTQLERHSHRRAQFLYAMNGLMKVETDDGQWLVPLQRRVDPGHPSASGTDAGVSTHSLYIEPDAAPRAGERCEVLQVSPLLHQLLLSACQLPLLYHEDGHDGALIELVLHELKAASPRRCLPTSAKCAAGCAMQRLSAPAGYSQHAGTVGRRAE